MQAWSSALAVNGSNVNIVINKNNVFLGFIHFTLLINCILRSVHSTTEERGSLYQLKKNVVGNTGIKEMEHHPTRIHVKTFLPSSLFCLVMKIFFVYIP